MQDMVENAYDKKLKIKLRTAFVLTNDPSAHTGNKTSSLVSKLLMAWEIIPTL